MSEQPAAVAMIERGVHSSANLQLAEARLRAILKEHHGMLWRFLRRLGVPEADVDDGLQEIILVVAKRLDEVPDGSERSFLLSTAFRVACSMRRRRGRRAEISSELVGDLISGEPDAECLTELKQMRELLDRILEAIPLEMRVVFVLDESEGLTMAQVASLLDIPSGTAASRLRRGREDFLQRVTRFEARLRTPRGA